MGDVVGGAVNRDVRRFGVGGYFEPDGADKEWEQGNRVQLERFDVDEFQGSQYRRY